MKGHPVSRKHRAFATKIVCIVTALSLVFLQTPVRYALADDDDVAQATSQVAEEQQATTVVAEEPVVETALPEEQLAIQDDVDIQEEESVADKSTTELSPEEPDSEAEASADADAVVDEAGEAEDKESEEKGSEEKEKADEKNTETVFTRTSGGVTVVATLSDPESLPAGSQLQVTPITAGTSGYDYGAYLDAVDGVTQGEATSENTLLYDVCFVYTDKDGKTTEIEPDGSVKVEFNFNRQQLTEGIEAVNPSDVEVTHVLDSGVAEPVDAYVNGNSATFTTSSFSVFAFSYTVDFTYGGYVYSFPGQGSYELADILAVLGIQDAVDSATLTLVEGEAVEGDLYLTQNGSWRINSDVPFSSTYELSVVCGNSTYLITVTDVQESTALVNFLKNAVIEGATQNEDGAYQVQEGKPYSISLMFAEGSDYQFKNDSPLTYHMPDGIIVSNEQNGEFSINVMFRGALYPVKAIYNLNTDGELTINFDQTDPNYSKLVSATDVSFHFSYNAEFEAGAEEIKFSDTVKRDIVFEDPEPGQAYVEKVGVFDETTGTFNYTVTVTAEGGDVANVNVKDVISGDALIFKDDVVVKDDQGVDYPDDKYTKNPAANGFDYTFAEMKDGEKIIITYSAKVDFSKDADGDGKITVDQTKNTVTVGPDDNPHTSEYSHEITYKTTRKSDGSEAGTTKDGDKILNWTITYNGLVLAPVGGDTITDTIVGDSADYMTYYGDTITVKVYDHDGALVETRTEPYTSLTSHSPSSWTYTIPDSDIVPYKYVIEYQTVVDMAKVPAGAVVPLSNKANDDWGGYNVNPTGGATITKSVDSYDTSEVMWTSTLTVPREGLAQAIVIDTLPGKYLAATEKMYYDSYKSATVVSGLLEGESYTIVETSDHEVKITFFKDEEHQETGLKPSASERKIVIKLTTSVNQEWLNKGYESSEPADKNHVNNIRIGNSTATAFVTFEKPGIEKNGEVEKDEDGNVTGLKYTLTFTGVTDTPISVRDTFDRNLLEVGTSQPTNPYNNEHMKIFGGNAYWQGSGATNVSYTDTDDGILITADSVPLNSDGNYYSHYRIVYFLKLKEGVDLDALAKANGGTHHLENTARWGNHRDSFDYETKYNFLTKELLNESDLGLQEDGTVNRIAQYKITLNPDKATLNRGESLTMTDVLGSNLSLDYSSVSIETDPAGLPVAYAASGAGEGKTKVEYLVPDNTKVVVTYKALVTGYGQQEIENVVTVKDEKAKVWNKSEYGSASQGGASLVSFKIAKVDGYNAAKKLAGVKFKIWCENPNVNFGSKVGNAKELILETDENGVIELSSEKCDFYYYDASDQSAVKNIYHLQEIAPPDGYGSINFDYTVRLTKDMSKVNYDEYIYYFNDAMQIKNWPLEGLVVKKQVESSEAADKEKVFNFKVSVLNEDGAVNTDFNELVGRDQFKNGTFEFELKDGQTRMLQGFAEGTKYKVEEIFNAGEEDEFATEVGYGILDEGGNLVSPTTESGTSHSGQTSQADQMVIFKNSKTDTGSLKISKTLEGNATDPEKEFTFTIKVEGATGSYAASGAVDSVTFDAGEATVKLKGGESATISGLPVDAAYSVTEVEADQDGYTTISEGASGTIEADRTADATPEAAFTNIRNKGGLIITKTFAGDIDQLTEADKNKISFTVTGPEWPDAQTFTYAQMENGVKIYDAVALGDYTVTETVASGKTYTTTYKVGSEGTQKTGTSTTATVDEKGITVSFTNTYEVVPTSIELQATKSINNWGKAKSFEFVLASVDGAPMPEGAADGRKAVNVTPDSKTAKFGEISYDAPGTYEYTITETKGDVANITYDTTPHKVVVTVSDNGDGTLSAAATYDGKGSLTIKNTYTEGGKRSPKTGDNLLVVAGVIAAVALASLGLLAYAKRRKERDR